MKQERCLGIARLVLLALATAVLLWSGVEDQDVVMASVLGAALSLAGVVWFLVKRGFLEGQTRLSFMLSVVLVGLLSGALSSLFAVALMLFKDMRHGHPFPDYPPMLMLAMLERLPAWTIAGGLIGLGCALFIDLFRGFGRGER